MTDKVLITSGCSFSETTSGEIETWPLHLHSHLSFNTFRNGGLGCQGNGLVSRKAIYYITEALKTHQPEDILVGIMWTGQDRHDFRCTDPSLLQFKIDGVDNHWMENPTKVVDGANNNWVILNHHWAIIPEPVINEEAKLYYKYFHDEVGSVIYTIEHMLRVQWLLEKHKINYFFCMYLDAVFESNPYARHSEVKHLYDQLNFDNFLPVTSMGKWVEQNSVYKNDIHNGDHPSSRQHKEFTDQVIIPWLVEKKYI